MADFFQMGGYGSYVWSAYAVFAVVLLVDAFAPLWQRRGTLRSIAARLQREATRQAPIGNRPSDTKNETP